jgi:DNA-binding transcriptional LysR family regulator
MDLRELRVVLALADSGTTRAAAERLHITQQAVSRIVRDAEHAVGAPLFSRSPAGMVPTPAGEAFVPRARDAVRAVEETVTAARAAAGGPLPVTLAAARVLGDVLQDVLAELYSAVPLWQINIVDAPSNEQPTLVRERQVLAGIVTLPLPEDPEINAGLETVLLDTAPMQALVPAVSPLAKACSVTLAALAGEPLVLPTAASAPIVRRQVLDVFARAGLDPRIAAETSRHETIEVMVSHLGGYSLCMRPADLRRPDLCLVPVAGDTPTWQTALLYRRDLSAGWKRTLGAAGRSVRRRRLASLSGNSATPPDKTAE